METEKENVKMFIEAHFFDSIYKDYDFFFENCSLVKQDDGWFRVEVNWKSRNDPTLFKVCQSSGTMWSMGSVSQELKFSYLDWKKKHEEDYEPSITIGLESTDNSQIKYNVKFFENIKYGVIVYFAPSEFGNKHTIIEKYTEEFQV